MKNNRANPAMSDALMRPVQVAGAERHDYNVVWKRVFFPNLQQGWKRWQHEKLGAVVVFYSTRTMPVPPRRGEKKEQ